MKNHIRFNLGELEQHLWNAALETFQQAMVEILSILDLYLMAKRDASGDQRTLSESFKELPGDEPHLRDLNNRQAGAFWRKITRETSYCGTILIENIFENKPGCRPGIQI